MKRRDRIWVLLIAVLLIVSSLPVAAFAGDGAPEKEVRVGFFYMENFMEGGSDGSAQSGFTYELLCEIAAYNHWDIEYVYGDFSDLYKQLEQGNIDILPNIIDTEERRQHVLFHDLPLNTEHYYVSALRTGAAEEEPEPGILNGKRLATVKDAYEEQYFDEWASQNGVAMEKVYCDGFDEAWELVRAGKADYILNINNTAPDASFSPLFEVGKHVYTDELHANEVLINLTSNAVKYTPAGGRVRFRVEQVSPVADGKTVFRFAVEDDGIGMSEEFQQHLFEAFSREKTSTVSKQQGAGLGLSIVKKIVDLAGGTIRVSSKQNEGSVFTVEVPMRVMDAEAIRKYEEENKPPEISEKEFSLENKKSSLWRTMR